MANGQNSKKPQSKKPAAPKRGRRWMPLFGGPSFLSNLVTTILIFLLLMSGYSLFADFTTSPEIIPLSQVAADVEAGKISAIKVSGNALSDTFADGTEHSSVK